MKETPLDYDFLILNRLPNLYSARRFQEEINRDNLNGRLISPEDLQKQISQLENSPGSKFRPGPAILYRQGDYNLWATHKFLSSLNLKIVNSPSAFLNARDKWKSYLSFKENNIPTPKTMSAVQLLFPRLEKNETTTTEQVEPSIKYLYQTASQQLKLPFILKKRFSGQGRGVFLIHHCSELETILIADAINFQSADELEKEYYLQDAKKDLNQFKMHTLQFLFRWIFQKCIHESLGKDVRAFVISNKIYSIERSNSNSFRSNLHQGGVALNTTLSKSEVELCERIHRKSPLNYSGIDFMRTKNDPLFLEINPSPGFEGIESQFSVNIARDLIKLMV